MIAKLRISNYKLLRSIELEFGRLNVIVGRNGIGKSSILRALELSHRLAQPLKSTDNLASHFAAAMAEPRELAASLSLPAAHEIQTEVVLTPLFSGPSFDSAR